MKKATSAFLAAVILIVFTFSVSAEAATTTAAATTAKATSETYPKKLKYSTTLLDSGYTKFTWSSDPKADRYVLYSLDSAVPDAKYKKVVSIKPSDKSKISWTLKTAVSKTTTFKLQAEKIAIPSGFVGNWKVTPETWTTENLGEEYDENAINMLRLIMPDLFNLLLAIDKNGGAVYKMGKVSANATVKYVSKDTVLISESVSTKSKQTSASDSSSSFDLSSGISIGEAYGVLKDGKLYAYENEDRTGAKMIFEPVEVEDDD